ncbi:hypothetical protein FHW12_003136 [Dokdonella fugitiva]|uniref:Uncharacterized protein n=1 Tax=Dokdonella fugitiva TaxID=328517 RepID=A0A839F755_9GAMM|nr:hypothetical protein [Dokdonella fugitiva]MBA8888900.1 hypothetical protein [Dokdonella fugitiva]
MNATTTAGPIPLNSIELQTRIDAERSRLHIEQNLLVDLEGQRLAPLEAGDDEALDRVEAQINACNDRQSRIQERLEILERRLTEATERERQQDLDAVAARGHRARVLGEQIIAEYGKRAPELAALIERLAACDQIVNEANTILSRANRDSDLIPSPNAIRCRPRRRWTETVRKTVGPSDRGHPAYGLEYTRARHSPTVHVGREAFDLFVEADVEVEMTDCGDRPDPLQDAVVLPALGPAADANTGLVPLWDRGSNHRACASEAVVAEVRERIDRDPNASDAPVKRKKSTDRGEA